MIKKIAYIGSANIAKYSHLKADHKLWHDITVRLENVNLQELEYAYNKSWYCIMFKSKNHYQSLSIEPIIRLNDTWKKRRNLYKSLLRKIDQSKKRIEIACAYFVPRRSLLIRIARAARRGVSVTIIVPKDPDVIGISLLTKAFYYVLLKSGVNILHHTDGILHAKFLIIDDWFCVGSSNLNYRSLHSDLEVDVNIQTLSSKTVLEKQFESYRHHSQAFTLQDLSNQSIWEKMMTRFLWFFKFLF